MVVVAGMWMLVFLKSSLDLWCGHCLLLLGQKLCGMFCFLIDLIFFHTSVVGVDGLRDETRDVIAVTSMVCDLDWEVVIIEQTFHIPRDVLSDSWVAES